MPDLVGNDDLTRHDRLRIARDLHDTVAQRLAVMGYELDEVIADEEMPSDRKRTLRRLRLDLGAVVHELRDEILALRTDDATPIHEWLMERIALAVHWRMIEHLDLEASQRDELRHLLLELLRNEEKHAGLVEVIIEERSRSIQAQFMQRGENRPRLSENLVQLGRVGLAERLVAIGGTLEESEVGFTLRWM